MGVVGKSDSKENPKSDLDLDLGFVNFITVVKIDYFGENSWM